MTRPPGYMLALARDQLDLNRFEDLAAAARATARAGDVPAGAAELRHALSLWRGPALADLVPGTFTPAKAVRLTELRMAAIEDLIEMELSTQGSDLVPELQALVAEHPLRERLCGYLMVALYREERQAEALQAYETTRAVLAEELGIDPSQELQELHHRVLTQDPTLHALEVVRERRATVDFAPPPRGTAARRERTAKRRGWTVATAACVLLIIGSLTLLRLIHRTGNSALRGATGVARLSGTGRPLDDRIDIDGTPSSLAVDGSTVWVADRQRRTVTRLDTATGSSISIGSIGIPEAIAAGDDAAWVVDPFGGTVLRIDETGAVTTLKRLAAPVDAVYAFDSVWVLEATNERVFRLDPLTGRTQTQIDLLPGGGPLRIAAGTSSIWILNTLDRSLSRIDPTTDAMDLNAIPLFCGTAVQLCTPTDLSVSNDAIWVTIREGLIELFGPDGQARWTVTDVAGPEEVTADAGGAWVLTSRRAGLVRLDANGTVLGRVRTTPPPIAVANDSSSTWVALAP